MRHLRWAVAFVVVALAVTACGDGDGEPVAFDPEGADSCQELADMFIGTHQRMLEAIGDATDEDLAGDIPPDLEAAGEELLEWFSGSAGARIGELCDGGAEEFEALACEQESKLEAEGEAGERHLREAFPPCDG